MADESNALIISMIEQLRKDMAQDRDASHESRVSTHRRIDEVISRLGRIDTTVALAGQVDAMVRQELDAMKQAVSDIRPAVDEWRRIRRLGLGIVGLMTAGGLTVGAALQWGGDSLVTALRNWLHIR